MTEFKEEAKEHLKVAQEAASKLVHEAHRLQLRLAILPEYNLLNQGVEEEMFERLAEINIQLTRARVQLVQLYDKHGRFTE